jgi:hypothetical protein
MLNLKPIVTEAAEDYTEAEGHRASVDDSHGTGSSKDDSKTAALCISIAILSGSIS